VFHTPAEHTIDGKRYDMEMQIIHYGKSKRDIAKQLVLSFVFKKKAGVYNKFIDDLDFFNLPNKISKKRAILTDLFIPKIFYNADYQDIATMKPFNFYTYQGSLSAPPCSERTIYYVAATPIKLGSTAIQMFQEALRTPDVVDPVTGERTVSDSRPENNRAIQPLNGRAVFYYDSEKFCGNKKTIEKALTLRNSGSRKKVKGHYEKVPTQMTEYYYVNGPKPSGLPGSYVVSEKEAVGTDPNN